MTPNTSSTTDPIAEAIQLLTEEASGLRDCHTLAPGDWTGEPEAKAHYDRIMTVVNGLEKLRRQAEPLFWYRPRTDGGYEGPIHNSSIERGLLLSGAWAPLFTLSAEAA